MKFLFVLILFIGFSSISQNIIVPDINGTTQTYFPGASGMYPPAFKASNPFFNDNFPKKADKINQDFPKGGVVCGNMDTDNNLEVIYHSGNKVFCTNPNGTYVNGWPISIDSSETIEWVPSLGDITGNGFDDVVFTSKTRNGGKLYAYSKLGVILPGFPINIGKNPFIATLGDLNNDYNYEIILGSNLSNNDGELIVFEGDGSTLPGFPVNLGEKIAGNVAVGDINNDNQADIIIQSETKLWGFNSFGTPLNGFPYVLNGANEIFSYSSPILIDLDNDYNHEIIVCSHDNNNGRVYILKNDGSLLNGWPQITANWIYASPTVADIDNDGDFEIIIGDFNQSNTPDSYIYSFKTDGSLLQSSGSLYGITSITPADVNNDGLIDFLVDANNQDGLEGKYFALDNTLQTIEGWPMNITGSTIFSPVIISDLNQDGFMNIMSLNSDFTSNIAYVNVLESNINYASQSIISPFYQINTQHNGYVKSENTTEVSYNEESIDKIKLYPNPTKSILNIESESNIISLEVYSINGQKILYKEATEKLTSLDVNDMESGVYYIAINTSENTSILKFIKN